MPSSASDVVARHAVDDRHPWATRLAHIGLALSVIVQLLTSLVMYPPRDGRPGDIAFTLHEVAGLAALAFAFLFWIIVLRRRGGAPLALMVPWFSARRRAAFWADLWDHLRALRQGRFPDYRNHAPLAAAVHGLGLMLMAVMAVTGTIWFAAHLLGLPWSPALRLDILAHAALGNLVWAYLVGHAAIGLVHHLLDHADLRRMWSLGRD